jgi:TP901 family phage tail tape measure protein
MATKNIGGSITLEGASKYNSDLKQIKSNLTELRSEMKLANAENQTAMNTTEALTQKNEILGKQIEQAGKKVEIYGKMYDQAAQAQKKAGESVQTYSQQLNDAKTKLEQMKASGTATDEELKAQQAIINELNGKLGVAQSAYDRASAEMTKFQTAGNNAKAEVANLNAELQQNDQYLDEAKASADGCATSIDQFGKKVGDAGSGLDKTSEALELLASSEAFSMITEGSRKAAEALLECVDAADKWEGSMAKVQSIAQVNDNTLTKMGEDMRALAVDYGIGANEVAEATYQAISASVDAGDAVSFVEDAVKLAKGGFTDITTSVDALTTVTNAYGAEANSTQHIMDALIQTQNLGKTTVNELAQSLGMIIPTASAYNVSLDNVAAAYIQLTKQGINTANATTYLNGMMTELADGGSDVAQILVEKTGKSFGQLMKDGTSLGDVIEILGNSVDGDSEKFANLWSNVRAGRGAVTIFNASASEFNSAMQKVADSTGAADAAFEIMGDTAEMTDAKLNAAVENMKISIGEALQPAVEGLKKAGIEMLEPVTAFIEENPELLAALTGAVVGITGVATATTACAAAVAILKAAFGDLSGALSVLGTAAAIGAVTGLALASEDATEKYNEFTNSVKKSQATREADRASMELSAATVKKLTAELKGYQERANNSIKTDDLSSQEKARQAAVIAELNSILGEGTYVLEGNTDALDENSKANLANADALLARYEAEAAEEELKEIAKELYEAEKNLAEIEQLRTDALDAMTNAQSEYDTAAESSLGVQESQRQALADTKEAYENLDDQLTDAQSNVQNLQDEFNSVTEIFNENSEAANANAEAQGDLTASVEGLTKAEEEAAKDIEDANKALRDSVQNTVDTVNPLFDSLATTSKTSLTEVAKNLKENAKAAQEFADSLNTATSNAAYGTDTAYTQIVNTLAEQGPEATQLLKDFASGAEEGSESYKTAIENMREYIDGKESVATAIENLKTDIGTNMKGTNEELSNGTKEMNDTLKTSKDLNVRTLEMERDEMKTVTGETMTGMKEAVTSGAPQVQSEMQIAMTKTVESAKTVVGESGGRSEVFYTIGKTLMTSMANGISAQGSEVGKAMQQVLQRAIDNLDMSEFEKKVDRALGKKMTK